MLRRPSRGPKPVLVHAPNRLSVGSHPSTLWYLDEPRGALWFYIRRTFQAPGHQVSASSGYMKEGLWICGNIPPQRLTNELAFPLTQRRPWLGAHRDSYISFDPFCGTDWLHCAEFTVCSGTGGWIGKNWSSYLCKRCECCGRRAESGAAEPLFGSGGICEWSAWWAHSLWPKITDWEARMSQVIGSFKQ